MGSDRAAPPITPTMRVGELLIAQAPAFARLRNVEAYFERRP